MDGHSSPEDRSRFSVRADDDWGSRFLDRFDEFPPKLPELSVFLVTDSRLSWAHEDLYRYLRVEQGIEFEVAIDGVEDVGGVD